MNTLDLSWSRATHHRPKVIVFQIFQPRMVELSQILENSVELNVDENLPERQTSNNPGVS